MATTLMTVGGVITVGSFIFAAVNMALVFRSGAENTIFRHVGSMIGMVVGGAIFFSGLIMLLIQMF